MIGIGHTKKLPVLRSPVPQATFLAALLEREGYDVRLHIDRDLPRTARENLILPIKQSARNLVAKPGLKQLVIFFSGHGFCSPEKEDVWLLPNALEDEDQAIHVRSLEQLAYSSRVPNVVLIADACCSLPDRTAPAQARGCGDRTFYRHPRHVHRPSRLTGSTPRAARNRLSR